MPKVHYVKKARKDNPVVKKGESYYWWKFRFGGKHYSRKYPKRSLLTQSSFLSQMYDIEDTLSERFDGCSDVNDFAAAIDELLSELDGLYDECQYSYDNMPENLRDASDSGILLEERMCNIEAWKNGIENVDVEAIYQEREREFTPDDGEPEVDEMELENDIAAATRDDIVSEIDGLNLGNW